MKKFLATISVFIFFFYSPAYSLIIKKGQTIGSDGQIYDGLTPSQETIVRLREEDGKKAGVIGANFYIIIRDIVTTVPLSVLLESSDKETRKLLIKDAVRSNLLASFQLEDELEDNFDEDELDDEEDLDDELEDEDELEDLDDEIEEDLDDELDDDLDDELDDELEDLDDDLDDAEDEIDDALEEAEDEIEDALEDAEDEIEDEDDDDYDDD